jgi:hypothetical protein
MGAMSPNLSNNSVRRRLVTRFVQYRVNQRRIANGWAPHKGQSFYMRGEAVPGVFSRLLRWLRG